MPIPKPYPNEKKDVFISRCVKQLTKLDPDKPQKQRIAICFETWQNSKKK